MRKRLEAVLRHTDGKVLHVGCVGEYLWLDNLRHDIWIHGELVDQFGHENVVGIDAYEEGVEKLQEEGYDVHYANAESFDLDENFDTIVAPQMLHHLSNPGLALQCFKRHLKPDGKLVVAHPNAFFIERLLLEVFNPWKGYDSGEWDSYTEYTGHTCCHKPEHLFELVKREGFIPETAYYAPTGSKPRSWKGHVWHRAVLPVMDRILPDIFTKKTFVAVFTVEGK